MNEEKEVTIRFTYDPKGKGVSDRFNVSDPKTDQFWQTVERLISGNHDYCEAILSLLENSADHGFLLYLAVKGFMSAHRALIARKRLPPEVVNRINQMVKGDPHH